MSKWQSPIYDRTAADITNRTAKAFFNVSDWIRINGNTDQAKQLIQVFTGINADLTSLDEPVITGFPSSTEINSLIENIDILREIASLPTSLGLVTLKYDYQPGSGAVAPDYEDANDWERDLELVRDLLVRAADYTVYCGVGGAGQSRFWQVRFRTWPWIEPAVSPARLSRTGPAISGTGTTRQNSWRKYA